METIGTVRNTVNMGVELVASSWSLLSLGGVVVDRVERWLTTFSGS